MDFLYRSLVDKLYKRFNFFIKGKKLYIGKYKNEQMPNSFFIDCLNDLPFEADVFDAIILDDYLSKGSRGVKFVLLEIYRSLKVNGKLFIIGDTKINTILSEVGFKHVIFVPLINNKLKWLNRFMKREYFIITYKEKDFSLE